ncbi:MAG: hypothetical protein ACREL1_03185, partial [bacterium]
SALPAAETKGLAAKTVLTGPASARAAAVPARIDPVRVRKATAVDLKTATANPSRMILEIGRVEMKKPRPKSRGFFYE